MLHCACANVAASPNLATPLHPQTATTTKPTATMFGKLIHLGFDALLISAVLAGIKRTTGLAYGLSHLSSGNTMI
jgi:hypothetical protein